MVRVVLSFLFALCLARAGDARLDALRASMIGMRGKWPAAAADEPRGATPQLTVAKRQLRDWVETRLQSLTERGDEGDLERRLNAELHDAGLFCSYTGPDDQQCPDEALLGFLDPLKLHRTGVFLIFQTGVGIECGFDESAYVYAWSDEGWRRVWQNEQNSYTKKDYKPQTIQAVLISPYNNVNDYLLLTLGTGSWCASNWHDVYYRAFRLGGDPRAAPLIEGAEWAFLDGDPPIKGSITHDDVLIEFRIRSIDVGVHNRAAVRNYQITEDGAKRVDPLALSPRDFVDEWLTHDWREAAVWSESPNRRSMRDWRRKLHYFGDFLYPTLHCPATPDLWQVGIDLSDPPASAGAQPANMVYFVVRWRPPYHFTMVEVSDHPRPGCTEKDPGADENRTLFPPQN